jgi:hypothetical protein
MNSDVAYVALLAIVLSANTNFTKVKGFLSPQKIVENRNVQSIVTKVMGPDAYVSLYRRMHPNRGYYRSDSLRAAQGVPLD